MPVCRGIKNFSHKPFLSPSFHNKTTPRKSTPAPGTRQADPKTPEYLQLLALRSSNIENTAAMTGDMISDARQDYNQNQQVEVSMNMTTDGGKIWKKLTAKNVGNQIAIVLDGYIYSAPNVGGNKGREKYKKRTIPT